MPTGVRVLLRLLVAPIRVAQIAVASIVPASGGTAPRGY